MNEYVFNSLSNEQKVLFSEFMKDFIVGEIHNQVVLIKNANNSVPNAADHIFHIDNKLFKYQKMVGFPEDWEYVQEIETCQHKAVKELESYLKEQNFNLLEKKCKCSSFEMELSEVRALFEKSYVEKYLVNHDFVKIVTNEGLKYKDPQLQDSWEGFLLFGIVLKSVKNPVTGELM